MADEVKTAENTAEEKEPTYTRESLAASKKYRAQRDIIMCALEADKSYTESEVKEKIDTFLKAEIKEEINGKD